MAEFGLRHPCFKPHNAANGINFGKAVLANLSVTLASGELYADDGLAEQISEFASGSLAMETDNMEDSDATVIYGATATDGEVIYNRDDVAPRGVLGYVKVLMVKGVRKYRTYVYPDAQASIGNDDGQTRGSNITFQTAKTTFTIFADDAGNWRRVKTFSTLQAAIAHVDTACGISDSGTPNANLAALTVGLLNLSPAFDPLTVRYAATTSDATSVVTAVAADPNASITITNGETSVSNGDAASWAEGENELTIIVTKGTASKTYTVKVNRGT